MTDIPRIRKLSKETVRLIAAGEVIENVGSVVRELVENSIDAESTRIEVSLEDGGKKMIQVKDDGCGMTREEVLLSVKRFTTSKIDKVEDLRKKRTLGFRGEALFAIASVSRVRIRSSTDGIEGWEFSFEEGEPKSEKPLALPRGTSVEVFDIFFNLPARRKFLGSPYQEGREASEILISYALAHPGISFSLVIDRRELFSLEPSSDLWERIEGVYGEDFMSRMMKIEKDYRDTLKIRGVVSRPDRLRERSSIQWIFVNGRRVQDRKTRAALYRAIGHDSRHPDFIVFLDVAPEAIDFNVHPQKKEVKFSPSLRIFDKLVGAVRSAMKEEEKRLTVSGIPMKVLEARDSGYLEESGRQLEFGELPSDLPPEEEKERWIPQALWQVHNRYIIAQVKSGIIIVDQHAAHERVIYERLEGRNPKVQMLLFPMVINLRRSLLTTLEEVSPMMERIGFRFRVLSGGSVVVEGIPQVIRQLSKDDFLEILEEIGDEKRLPERFKGLLKTVACKAAIKAGDPLDQKEMNALLDQLFAAKSPFFCPHGRPAIIRMTLEELDRKFDRH